MNPDTTPTSITPHLSEESSGLLPQEDWGKWVPRIEGNKRLKLPIQPARRSVLCYTCKQPTFVPEKALSALCTHCRSHLQLVDVLLSKSIPRSRVRTLGCLTVAADTQLSQVDFECDRIVIKGNVDGKIVCHNEMRISTPELRLTRPLRTQSLIIESGSTVYLSEGVHADRVIIHGELHGFIRARVSISIESSGSLHGDCNTPSLRFGARGGRHNGRWDSDTKI